MVSSCSLQQQKSFRIKHEEEDTKFFARFLSKENNSKPNIPSFRIPSSIPFIWESQPGTPKHHQTCNNNNNNNNVPPLTPPPSYYTKNNNNINREKPIKKNSRSMIFHSLFKKLIKPKKSHLPPSPSSSSSSSSSSDNSAHFSVSVPITPLCFNRRLRFVCTRGGSSSFDHDDKVSSHQKVSKLCFGISRSTEVKSDGNQDGTNNIMMKKALFSILRGQRFN